MIKITNLIFVLACDKGVSEVHGCSVPCCNWLWAVGEVELNSGLCVWTLPLHFAHLETGQYKNSPNAWKLTSKTAP